MTTAPRVITVTVHVYEDDLLSTPQAAANAVNHAIYSVATKLFEHGERHRRIHGKGHHMAQEIALEAQRLWLERAG